MASIYKHSRGNTPYWICVFTDETGKQRHRSTRTKNRGEAVAACQLMQKHADTLKNGRSLTNKGMIRETFIDLTQKAERGEFTDATARKALNELLVGSGQSPMELTTTEQFLTAWVNSKELAKAPGTAKRYRHTVETFVQMLGTKAKKNLAAITPRDIEAFRDSQITEGKSPSTANMAVKTLRIPFNLARRQGLILTNPAEAVEILDAPPQRRGTFSIEELAQLLEAANWEWRGLILLGATCGMRLGDAARLTWSNVNIETKMIRYNPQKTKRGTTARAVETPILFDLADWLADWQGRSERPDSPLMPTLAKMRTGGCNGLSARFCKLMNAASVCGNEDKRELKGKGRHFNDLTFHSLRHTFISTLANLGVREEVRMKLAGHSTAKVHAGYTHHESTAIHKELAGFPRIEHKGK